MMTIREYLSSLMIEPVRSYGRKLIYHCPVHDDRHPSFEVVTGIPGRKGEEICRCYACGFHGTVIELMKEITGLSYHECYRIAKGEEVIIEMTKPEKKEKELASPLQRAIIKFFGEWWHEQLLLKEHIHARNYFLRRGVGNSVQLSPIFGYAPRDPDKKLATAIVGDIKERFEWAGLSECEHIGILKKGDDGKLFLPIQNRVTLLCLDPFDTGGDPDPVCYQARAIEWEGQKYPPTCKKLVPRDMTKSPFWIPGADRLYQATIVAENAFGTAGLAGYSVPSFATLGAGMDLRFVLALLKRFPQPVYFAMDNDIGKVMKRTGEVKYAGNEQAKVFMELCESQGIESHRLMPIQYDEKENGIDDMIVHGDIGAILREIACNELKLAV